MADRISIIPRNLDNICKLSVLSLVIMISGCSDAGGERMQLIQKTSSPNGSFVARAYWDDGSPGFNGRGRVELEKPEDQGTTLVYEGQGGEPLELVWTQANSLVIKACDARGVEFRPRVLYEHAWTDSLIVSLITDENESVLGSGLEPCSKLN